MAVVVYVREVWDGGVGEWGKVALGVKAGEVGASGRRVGVEAVLVVLGD